MQQQIKQKQNMQYTKLNIGNKIINLSNHVYSTPHRDAAKT